MEVVEVEEEEVLESEEILMVFCTMVEEEAREGRGVEEERSFITLRLGVVERVEEGVEVEEGEAAFSWIIFCNFAEAGERVEEVDAEMARFREPARVAELVVGEGEG